MQHYFHSDHSEKTMATTLTAVVTFPRTSKKRLH